MAWNVLRNPKTNLHTIESPKNGNVANVGGTFIHIVKLSLNVIRPLSGLTRPELSKLSELAQAGSIKATEHHSVDGSTLRIPFPQKQPG